MGPPVKTPNVDIATSLLKMYILKTWRNFCLLVRETTFCTHQCISYVYSWLVAQNKVESLNVFVIWRNKVWNSSSTEDRSLENEMCTISQEFNGTKNIVKYKKWQRR